MNSGLGNTGFIWLTVNEIALNNAKQNNADWARSWQFIKR